MKKRTSKIIYLRSSIQKSPDLQKKVKQMLENISLNKRTKKKEFRRYLPSEFYAKVTQEATRPIKRK
jgi:hypothetical protein